MSSPVAMSLVMLVLVLMAILLSGGFGSGFGSRHCAAVLPAGAEHCDAQMMGSPVAVPIIVLVLMLVLVAMLLSRGCSSCLGGRHRAAVLALDVEGGVDAARLGAEDGVDVDLAELAGLHLHSKTPVRCLWAQPSHASTVR